MAVFSLPPTPPPLLPLPPSKGAGVLGVVGETPLVQLSRLPLPRDWSLYAKLDGLNPAGSSKDRAALRALEDAFAQGRIDHDSLIVESSSGNMGVGLAQACSYHGLRFVCVVDPHTTRQNIQLMRAYGAQVEVVRQADPTNHSYLPTRLARVRDILASTPGAFWINQYENQSCVAAHRDGTAPEIVAALGGFPDYFVCAVGTCATIQGCALYFQQQGAPTQIVGVDSIGSTILGGQAAPRKIPGMGSVQTSPLLQRDLLHIEVKVAEDDAIQWCRTLARTEAILAGGSSGAVLAALSQIRGQIPAGASVVALLPDRGERYLDLIFDDTDEKDSAEHAHE